MDGVVINCPAKVNLALAVLGRDESAGMHFIDSVVAKISLSDRLTLIDCCGEGFHTEFTFAPGVRAERIDPRDNTITRAHAAVEEVLGITLPPLAVSVEKHIPVGGGLGGGSSDAAGFIAGLYQFAEMGLLGGAGKAIEDAEKADWFEVAQIVGMDMHTFFIMDEVFRVRGFGEEFEPIDLPGLKDLRCAVIDPGVSLSTRDMYGRVSRYSKESHVEEFLQEWRAQALSAELALAGKSYVDAAGEARATRRATANGLEKALAFARNDFTDIARKANKKVAVVLREYEGRFPLVAVTGSGSCIIAVGKVRALREAGLTPYRFLTAPAPPV
jgi:4-diphosphocytidyl-2-C-methyl-D-erythritol kinase